MDGSENPHGPARGRIADGFGAVRHVFVRDLVTVAHIGVWDHEKQAGQRVRINVDLAVDDDPAHQDRLENVLCYNEIVLGIRAIIERGHVNLAETLAEDIARMALADPRARSVRVRVEKLDVVPEAASVGVEIERFRAG